MNKKVDTVTKNLTNYVEKELKKDFIKNMIVGSQLAYEMIYSMIESGESLENIKSFCSKMMKNKNSVEKIMTKEGE
jgi:hypothetical protein